MTEVTGVIIAEYVAMITVVTEMTMTDVTETGTVTIAMVETIVTVGGVAADHLVEMMTEKRNDLHQMMTADKDRQVILGVTQEDVPQMIEDVDQMSQGDVLLMTEIVILTDQDSGHLLDRRMNKDVQRLGGDRRRRGGVGKRKT